MKIKKLNQVNVAPKLHTNASQPWQLDACNIVVVAHVTGEQQIECSAHVQFTNRYFRAW